MDMNYVAIQAANNPVAYTRHFRCLSCLAFVGLGLLSIASGIGRTLTCGHFFNLGIDFWNGLALFIAAAYVVLIDWPKQFTAKFVLYFVFFNGFVVFGIAVLSLILEIGERQMPIEFTAALVGRAFHAVESCRRLFADIGAMHTTISEFGDILIGDKLIRFIRLVSYCVSGTIGFLQIIVCSTVIKRIKLLFTHRPFKSSHIHVVLGFVCIIAGSVHLLYCCRYYYVCLGILSGLSFLTAGIYHSNVNFPTKFILLVLNALCIVFSGTLIPLSLLGFVCWLPKGFRPTYLSPYASLLLLGASSTMSSHQLPSPSLAQSKTPIPVISNSNNNHNSDNWYASSTTAGPNHPFTSPHYWPRTNYFEALACIEEKDEYFKLARLANGDMYSKCLKGLEIMGYWSETSPTYFQFAFIHLQYIQVSACLTLAVVGVIEFLFSIVNLIVIYFSDDY